MATHEAAAPAIDREETTPAPTDVAVPAPSNAFARLIALEKGLYCFTMIGGAAWTGAVPGLTLPAVHIAGLPQNQEGLEITDIYGQPAAWLGARHSAVFLKSPADGSLALITAYPPRDPARPAIEIEIQRLDEPPLAAFPGEKESEDQPGTAEAPSRRPPLATLFLADPIATPASAAEVRVEIVLHIRDRQDLRFIDAPWAGRIAPGMWIGSFTVLPRHRLAAAAIEYKGLTAAGIETEWIGSGFPCGTRDAETPLVGFAVRQKAIAGDALFDCVYSGYFHSGAVVGPCRNGAPCFSAVANDPLEGIQLRIIERPKRPSLPQPAAAPDDTASFPAVTAQ